MAHHSHLSSSGRPPSSSPRIIPAPGLLAGPLRVYDTHGGITPEAKKHQVTPVAPACVDYKNKDEAEELANTVHLPDISQLVDAYLFLQERDSDIYLDDEEPLFRIARKAVADERIGNWLQ